MRKSQIISLIITLFLAICFAVFCFVIKNEGSNSVEIVTITTSKSDFTSFPIDLNSITKEQLMEINGIGESLADRILKYRTDNGKFNNVDELLNVSGIGNSKFEVLKDYVYVKNPIYTTVTTTQNVEILTSQKTTTTKKITTSKDTTKVTISNTTPPKSTTTKVKTSKVTTTTVTMQKIRTFVNINTASFEEIRDGLLLTDEQALAIVNLRNDISYFSNPLEVLYATKPGTRKTMFSEDDYNEFKDYILIE